MEFQALLSISTTLLKGNFSLKHKPQTVVPCSCATPSFAIFAATPFWIGFKKKLELSFFFKLSYFFSKYKTVKKNSVHFNTYLTTNPNDDSSQLSFDVFYVSVTLKLTILEKKIKLHKLFRSKQHNWGEKCKNSIAAKIVQDIYYKKLTPS